MIISGKDIQKKRMAALSARVAGLEKQPVLVIIQVGDNRESAIYISQKIKFGKSAGCGVEHYQLEDAVTTEFVRNLIEDFNHDEDVTGIIVQLPLPEALEASRFDIIDTIDPHKDVDGLTSVNLKRLMSAQKGIVPATARGVMTLLEESGVDVAGKHAVIVGRSVLVGRSLGQLLLNNDATVTTCHSKTDNLQEITRQADILISATGKPGLIASGHVSAGQTVIDVGITADIEGVSGDVDFEAVADTVENITPVPGGVGPMTVLSLFENLVDQAEAGLTSSS